MGGTICVLLGFQAVSYSLGPGRRVVVSGAVGEGEALVIKGASGAGKTTLLRILARLAPCPGGEVFLAGENWLRIPGPAWRTAVHYLAQKPALFDGSVAANLARPFETRMVRSGKSFDPEFAQAVMKELLLPTGLWEQDARTLPGGEAARVALVRALSLSPPRPAAGRTGGRPGSLGPGSLVPPHPGRRPAPVCGRPSGPA